MNNNLNNAWRIAYKDITQYLKDNNVEVYRDENNDLWNANGSYIFSKYQKKLNRELKINSINMLNNKNALK